MASLIQRRKQERRGKENGSRQFSVPPVFATKITKKIQLTFWCITQQAHQNIQNIRKNRSFGKRKTYLFRNIFVFRNIPNENFVFALTNTSQETSHSNSVVFSGIVQLSET